MKFDSKDIKILIGELNYIIKKNRKKIEKNELIIDEMFTIFNECIAENEEYMIEQHVILELIDFLNTSLNADLNKHNPVSLNNRE